MWKPSTVLQIFYLPCQSCSDLSLHCLLFQISKIRWYSKRRKRHQNDFLSVMMIVTPLALGLMLRNCSASRVLCLIIINSKLTLGSSNKRWEKQGERKQAKTRECRRKNKLKLKATLEDVLLKWRKRNYIAIKRKKTL